MKKVILTLCVAAATLLAASTLARAHDYGDEHEDSHAKDLLELKQLHVDYHQAVSHAGIDAATKAEHVKAALEVWTEDGVLVVGGVSYSGKGKPGTPSCDAGTLTLCDFYTHHSGAFVLGHDYVSLTPIFTESITVLDRDHAQIYFQCIYLDVNNSDMLVSNVSFGAPGKPETGLAKRVHGHWKLSYALVNSVPPPTLDVYQ